MKRYEEVIRVSHAPRSPFGCVVTWGLPRVRDGGIHVCDRNDNHRGRHRCACGASHNAPSDASDSPSDDRLRPEATA